MLRDPIGWLESSIPLAAHPGNRFVGVGFAVKNDHPSIVGYFGIAGDKERKGFYTVAFKASAPMVWPVFERTLICLLYTSDAADE